MANKKSETSPGTHKRYQNAVDKLVEFLGDRAEGDIAYIHKRDLTALRDNRGGVVGFDREYRFEDSAGRVSPGGKGYSVKRTVSELSFHSLRPNTTSWFKRAGVPESVVHDIIGHKSEIVSRDYTHVDEGTKRTAIRRPLKITKPATLSSNGLL